jgi:NTE family protein
VGEELPVQPAREAARCALVLSGGGARGAYEVGVLRFLYGKLARRLGFTPRVDIFAGSSVGAVHCVHMAGRAHEPAAGVEAMAQIWRHMAFSRVYSFGVSDLAGFGRTFLGAVLGRSRGITSRAGRGPSRLRGLLNTTPLEQLVVRGVDWRQLRRNVREGRLASLCVSATEIATGRTVSWVDTAEQRVPSWTRDEHHIARAARVGPTHTLASAAIPLLFPAVRVGDTYYVDGGLRQHTPLTPALRLGGNRLLIIGLRHPGTASIDAPVAEHRLESFRSLGFLVGKLLNAFLIDRLDYDVGQMRVINRVLRAGISNFGKEFLDHVNPDVREVRGAGFQVVEDVFVRPSEDIGAIAADHVRRLRHESGRSWIGDLVFRALTRGQPEEEADFMSYLLFDGHYAADLISLGEIDAERCEETLARLFLE